MCSVSENCEMFEWYKCEWSQIFVRILPITIWTSYKISYNIMENDNKSLLPTFCVKIEISNNMKKRMAIAVWRPDST